jgi:hypothetical protein
MRLIEHCPNCFTSTSDEGNSDGGDKKKKRRKKLFMPLERYAILVFGDKFSDRDYYSKFYTSAAVQPKYFGAGKKYEIERKHKIKKRELLNDKLSNSKHYPTNIISRCDNIKGESH